jgi:integrase
MVGGGPFDRQGLIPETSFARCTGCSRRRSCRVRFHDLRHSAASLSIAEGVELAEISLLLGHSELRVTADLYTHLQKQSAAKAARHMDALLTRDYRRGGCPAAHCRPRLGHGAGVPQPWPGLL